MSDDQNTKSLFFNIGKSVCELGFTNHWKINSEGFKNFILIHASGDFYKYGTITEFTMYLTLFNLEISFGARYGTKEI